MILGVIIKKKQNSTIVSISFNNEQFFDTFYLDQWSYLFFISFNIFLYFNFSIKCIPILFQISYFCTSE